MRVRRVLGLGRGQPRTLLPLLGWALVTKEGVVERALRKLSVPAAVVLLLKEQQK